MKIGILFGPSSGAGLAAKVEEDLRPRLAGHEAAVVHGRFAGWGGGWIALEPRRGRRRGAAPGGYVAELGAAVEILGDWGAELLVCVGGDGLASYAADAMLSGGRPMVMAGIGTGTINVGPIVGIGAELQGFDPERLEIRRVGALEVLADGRHLAYGFNDVVLGDTYLATQEGEVANLSAEALLSLGAKLAAEPSGRLAGEGFALFKNGKRLERGPWEPHQLVASPLRPGEFFARAVAGVLCEAPYLRGGAALGLFDSVIVRAGRPERGWADLARSEQLLFEPGDLVEVEGLAPEALVIADGNPYAARPCRLGFRSLPDIVEVGG